MSGTRFAPGKDAELAWVDGQIQLNPDGADNVPVLDVFPNKQVMNLLECNISLVGLILEKNNH